MAEPFCLLLYVYTSSILFYILNILFVCCSFYTRSMFYFLVRGMCSEQFSLALDDVFLCLESKFLVTNGRNKKTSQLG